MKFPEMLLAAIAAATTIAPGDCLHINPSKREAHSMTGYGPMYRRSVVEESDFRLKKRADPQQDQGNVNRPGKKKVGFNVLEQPPSDASTSPGQGPGSSLRTQRQELEVPTEDNLDQFVEKWMPYVEKQIAVLESNIARAEGAMGGAYDDQITNIGEAPHLQMVVVNPTKKDRKLLAKFRSFKSLAENKKLPAAKRAEELWKLIKDIRKSGHMLELRVVS